MLEVIRLNRYRAVTETQIRVATSFVGRFRVICTLDDVLGCKVLKRINLQKGNLIMSFDRKSMLASFNGRIHIRDYKFVKAGFLCYCKNAKILEIYPSIYLPVLRNFFFKVPLEEYEYQGRSVHFP